MRRNLRTVGTAAVAAVVMLAGSGAMAVSHNALPGDELYGLKRWRESVQLRTVSGVAKGNRQLSLARVRLGEVRGLTERGVAALPPYRSTLETMDEHTVAGATILIAEYRRGIEGALDGVTGFTRAQAQDLTVLMDRLPPGVRPAARDSVATIEMIEKRVENILSGCDPCAEVPPTVSPPSDDGKPVEGDTPIGCACEEPDGAFSDSDERDRDTGNGGNGPNEGNGGDGDGDGGDGGDGGDEPEPDPDTLPDVPGTNIDDEVEEQVEDLIDDIRELVEETVPTPLPTPSLVP